MSERRSSTIPRSTRSTPVLRLADVHKTFPGPSPIHALDGVDLDVARGELLAIVGPSGSGKSTLLNVIGTLDRPTAGRVLLEGRDLARCRDRELAGIRSNRIGFVFQSFNLLAGLSATDNVATGLLYRHGRPRLRRRRAIETLERVGLGHRLDARPATMSGGERQRVAIARALVGDPAIVLADEPTGNLDSTTSAEIVQLLLRLHRDGSTIIVITHDEELAGRLPRIVRVRDGVVTEDVEVTA
ncbi:MAG: ABC transporter ATP-binding protein [Actinomycetota bacterium]